MLSRLIPRKLSCILICQNFLSFDLLQFPGPMLHTKYILIALIKKIVLLMLRISHISETEFKMIWTSRILAQLVKEGRKNCMVENK